MFTHDSETQSSMTPEKALELLKQGNERFRNNLRANRDTMGQIQITSHGQWPCAVVLSCIDSRVSSELVFDQGIGAIFSARVAGNFVNEDILGSMEYGCKVAGSKLVVVLGHRHCGAVKGACDQVELGNITSMLSKITPAVEAVKDPTDPEKRNSGNEEFVEAVAKRNVEMTLAAIRERSEILREMEAAKEIQIVGAMYDVESGWVNFLD
ncbi:MAG: carbonic anhydrase family protein [Planctomycetota bacterium]